MATFTTRLGDFIASFTDYRKFNATTDEKIETGMPYLFSFNYPFYSDNEQEKIEFERDFIRHFYMHEIGFETMGLFKMRLQDKLTMIMPRYKDIYLSRQLIGNNVLESVNLRDTERETSNRKRESTENGTANVNNNTTNDTNSQAIQSDNPQVTYRNHDFASSMTRSRDAGNVASKLDSSNTEENRENETYNRNNERTSVGWNGSKSDEISRFRELIISINEEVFKECEELFMCVYNSYTTRYNDFNMLGFGPCDMFQDSIDWMR